MGSNFNQDWGGWRRPGNQWSQEVGLCVLAPGEEWKPLVLHQRRSHASLFVENAGNASIGTPLGEWDHGWTNNYASGQHRMWYALILICTQYNAWWLPFYLIKNVIAIRNNLPCIDHNVIVYDRQSCALSSSHPSARYNYHRELYSTLYIYTATCAVQRVLAFFLLYLECNNIGMWHVTLI